MNSISQTQNYPTETLERTCTDRKHSNYGADGHGDYTKGRRRAKMWGEDGKATLKQHDRNDVVRGTERVECGYWGTEGVDRVFFG